MATTDNIVYREAAIADIDGMHTVRCAVKENKLSNPALITQQDYERMLAHGAAFVAEADTVIAGFAIADIPDKNIWALFIAPGYERIGIGRELHRLVIARCKQLHIDNLWLSTEPGTRAAKFYEQAGWQHTGLLPNGEIGFEYILS